MADLITYRPGLGSGVNVAQSPIDIDPNDATNCDAFLIKGGAIVAWPGFGSLTASTSQPVAISTFQSATLSTPSLIYLDNLAKLFVFAPGGGTWTLLGTGGGTGTLLSAPVHLVVYNEVVYYAMGNATSSWDGTTFTANIANSVGCRELGKLSAHLIAAHTFEGANNFPFRVRWSGSGAPTNWNPATDITAGFIDLDVPLISGYLEQSNYGLIYSPDSILQMNPTGSGQNPFSIIPYTGGTKGTQFKGVGNKWPYSLHGNGVYSFFVANDDVYMINPYGLSPIGGKAKIAIFADIATANTVAGWSPYFDETANSSYPVIIGSVIAGFKNSFPYPCYILAIPQGILNTASTILWIYNYIENTWVKRTINGWLNARIRTVYNPSNWSSGNNPETAYVTVFPIQSSGAP